MEKLEMFEVWKKVRSNEMPFSKFMIQLSLEFEELQKIRRNNKKTNDKNNKIRTY